MVGPVGGGVGGGDVVKARHWEEEEGVKEEVVGPQRRVGRAFIFWNGKLGLPSEQEESEERRGRRVEKEVLCWRKGVR